MKQSILSLILIKNDIATLLNDHDDHDVFAFTICPVSNSSRPLNRSTENSFIQGWPRPKVNVFTNSCQKKRPRLKKTCVQLHVSTVLNLNNFRHLLAGICEYYIKSRLTL